MLLAPLIAFAVIALATVALRGGQARQRRHLVGRVVDGPVDRPAILFFSGAACTICHTAQRPALERLAPELDGRVAVREIDVAAEPALARRFRVMSLPTTVVLDGEGRARAVNAGFASAQVLRGQLLDAGLLAAEASVA
ncbi:MAG TPA: thioredoxin family protein [Candidatus Angelobacter sp.]|jgi:thioredoxin-like negative regulator of GroEL|nr:thioredoxin family protein [Candidatus Angelobacter sp.]